MTTDMAALEDRILGIVRQHLPESGHAVRIGRDEELRSHGLDSMKSISLLLDLENAFQVTIPDDMLVPEGYRTLAGLVKTMDAAVRAGGA